MPHSTSPVFGVALLVLLAASGATGCRLTSNEESQSLELENSLAVCSDLQAMAERDAAAGLANEEAFRAAKAREMRILDDLIEHAVPERRAGYERQRARLDGCAHRPTSTAEAAAAEARNEEKRRVLLEEIQNLQGLPDLCRVAETTILSRPKTDACRKDLLKTACDRIASGTAGSEEWQEAVMGDYRGALTQCIRSLAGDDAALAAETFAVELKRELSDGRDLDTALMVAACRSGAKVLGNRVDAAPQVDYENACGSLGTASRLTQRSRMAACFRTAVDVCEIFVSHEGMALDKLIPAQEGSQKDQILRELYKGVDMAVCARNPTAHTACRTIGEAAAQIVKAVQTGNNDWAHCAGTDQLGACLGTLWGSGGFTNNNGVETAQQTGDVTYRGCCWCYKDYYTNDGWVSDTRYRRENWFGVIQAGDVATGNCKQMESKTHPGDKESTFGGYETYYEYSDCNRWYVAGDSCHAANGSHQVWNGEKKQWFKVSVP